MMRQGWDHNGWPLGLLVMITLGALVFWLVLTIIRRMDMNPADAPRQSVPPPRPSALQVLDERLARGEIDTEDYEQRRRALTNT